MLLIKNKRLLLIRSWWVVSFLPTCLGTISSTVSAGRAPSQAEPQRAQLHHWPLCADSENWNEKITSFLNYSYENMVLPIIPNSNKHNHHCIDPHRSYTFPSPDKIWVRNPNLQERVRARNSDQTSSLCKDTALQKGCAASDVRPESSWPRLGWGWYALLPPTR